jgi:predicted nucleotidyltransferase
MNQRRASVSRLGDALFTSTQQQVLGLLYGRPHESFYLKQILRMTGMGVHTIKRELDRMVNAEILTLTKIGNQHHYQANSDCPIYQELLAVVRKIFGVVGVLKIALQPIDGKLTHAFVFGSIAKAQDRADSDIDLLLVGNELVYSEVIELLTEAEESMSRTINPTIYETGQFSTKIKQGNAFLARVMDQPKLWIKGEKNDIGAAGESGTNQTGSSGATRSG